MHSGVGADCTPQPNQINTLKLLGASLKLQFPRNDTLAKQQFY
jgi:hypothetical protein